MMLLKHGTRRSAADGETKILTLTRFGVWLLVLAISCTRTTPADESPTGPSSAARLLSPPEGALLVFSGEANGPVLVVHGMSDPISLAPGFVAYDISPDGSTVVATREARLSTGISYNPELVLIDVRTQDRSLLAQTPPREEFNGPIKWSPDGSALAYVLVRYSVDPARVHPGPHAELQTVCVMKLETEMSSCFPQLRRVFDFDWSPDGKSLVVTGPGPLPMQVLNATTGHVSQLVTLDDTTLRQRLSRAGLGRAIQFVGPSWSPSGAYVAAWVNAPLPVPAIFAIDGKLVALGHPARGNAYELSWKPGADALVYATGFSLDRPQPWILRELTPSDDERVLLTAPNRPLTSDFGLSPSGRWVAVVRWKSDSHQEIVFVDLTEQQQSRPLAFSSLETLADWGPTE